MGIRDRVATALVKRALYSNKGMNRVWQSLFANGANHAVSHFTDYESYLLSIKRISWVYSCVSLIGYTVASNPHGIYKTGTDDLIEKHPFIDLLRKPNDQQTFFDLTEEAVEYLLLTGNEYEAHEQINSQGQPLELFNLRPSRITIIPDAETLVGGYLYEVNSQKIPFTTEEILHFKLPNPTDEHYGLGVVEAGENTFNTEMELTMSLLSFFANKAQPSGIMKVNGDIEPEDWEDVKKGWKAAHSGSKKVYGTAFLKGDLDYQQLGLDPGTIGQIEIANNTRDRILSMFGVPLGKLGIRETSEVKDDKEDRFFYKDTINPLLKRLQNRRNQWLEKVGWGDIEFRYTIREFDDLEEMLSAANKAFVSYSFTTNEIRKIGGQESLETGGDIILRPIGLEAVQVTPPKVKAQSSAGSKEQIDLWRKCNREIFSRKMIELGIDDEATIDALAKEAFPDPADNKAKSKTALLKALMKKRADLEKNVVKIFEPKFQDFFIAQRKRIVAAMNKTNKGDLTITKVWGAKVENDALKKAALPMLDYIVKNTIDDLMELFGKQEKQVDPGDSFLFPPDWEFPNLDKFLKEAATKVQRVNTTTRNAIKDQLSVGSKRGYSITQMVNGVEDEGYRGILGVFDNANKFRAETIARTETMLSYNNATIDTYGSVGLRKVELADNLVGHDDDDCTRRNGLELTLAKARVEVDSEHPNGSLVILPILP